MSNRAWVTLATNDSYGLGALVLAHSLRRAGSVYPAVVLITPSVTEPMRDRLRAVFADVVTVDVLDSRDAAHLALLQRPELGITFTKIHCWNLTQFEKCVFLDADILVVQNCDELFEREELSAAPDVGWPDCFNSGVFVFSPSNETFNKLIEFAQARGSFDGGDQGLLNSFFSDWAHGDINKHLPFLYNVTSAAFYSYLPALKHYGENLKIIHFIGAAKPWLQHFNWESFSVDAPEHLKEFLQLWWNVFVAQVHPQLDISMSGVAGNLARVVPGASGPQREALDELTRRQGWEAGNIDYMGADSFANIWAKISQTLSQPRTSPPKQSPPREPSPPQPLPAPESQPVEIRESVAEAIDVPKECKTLESAVPPAPKSSPVPAVAPAPIEASKPAEITEKIKLKEPAAASELSVSKPLDTPVDVPSPVEVAPPVGAPAVLEAAISSKISTVVEPIASSETPVVEKVAQPSETVVEAQIVQSTPPVAASVTETTTSVDMPALVEAGISDPVPVSVETDITTLSTPRVASSSPVETLEPKTSTPAVDSVPIAEFPITVEAPESIDTVADVEILPVDVGSVEVPLTVEAVEKVQSIPETKADVVKSVVAPVDSEVKPAVETPAVILSNIPVPVEAATKQEELKKTENLEEILSKIPEAVVPEPKEPEATKTPVSASDSPPLAHTPSKEEAPAVPAAKSEERRKPAGKLQLSPPAVADPLPTPDSELEDAATIAHSIIASELQAASPATPHATAAAPIAPLTPPTPATAPAKLDRLSVEGPEVPTPPVGAVSLSQIGVKPSKTKPTTAAQIESSVLKSESAPVTPAPKESTADPPKTAAEEAPKAAAAPTQNPEASKDPSLESAEAPKAAAATEAPKEGPKKKVVKKVVKKEGGTSGDAPVPPPRKKEKKPKEK